MATAGQTTLSASEVTLFSSPYGVKKIRIWVESGNAQLSCPAIHDTGDFVTLSAGKDVEFSSSETGIKSVLAKSSDSAVVSYAATSTND